MPLSPTTPSVSPTLLFADLSPWISVNVGWGPMPFLSHCPRLERRRSGQKGRRSQGEKYLWSPPRSLEQVSLCPIALLHIQTALYEGLL